VNPYDRQVAKKKSSNRADAVRSAVEQAFQAQVPRERISDLLDELGQTAGRLRGVVDELRPASAEDVKALRADIQALTKRIDALDRPAPPAPRRRAPAAKPAAGTAAKAPAKRAPAKPKPAA
jgi:hypothetical protein